MLKFESLEALIAKLDDDKAQGIAHATALMPSFIDMPVGVGSTMLTLARRSKASQLACLGAWADVFAPKPLVQPESSS